MPSCKVQSSPSFLDGASAPEDIEEAIALGSSGLTLNDHDGQSGVVRFATAARDLPTIIGVTANAGRDIRAQRASTGDQDAKVLAGRTHRDQEQARL